MAGTVQIQISHHQKIKPMTREEIDNEFRMILSHAFLGSDTSDIDKETWDLAIGGCVKFVQSLQQPIPQDIAKWIEDEAEKHAFQVPYDGTKTFYDELNLASFRVGATKVSELLLPRLQQLREENFSLKVRLGALASLIEAQHMKWEGLEKIADPEIWIKMYNHYQEILMNHEIEKHGTATPYKIANDLEEKEIQLQQLRETLQSLQIQYSELVVESSEQIEQQKSQIEELKKENGEAQAFYNKEFNKLLSEKDAEIEQQKERIEELKNSGAGLFSPIYSEREDQLRLMKRIFPDYPDGQFLFQYMNALLQFSLMTFDYRKQNDKQAAEIESLKQENERMKKDASILAVKRGKP